MTRYGRIEPIAPDHDTQSFDCGSDEQNGWLARHALQAHRSDTARVYVVCVEGSRAVAGYYALAAGSVEHDAASPRVTKGVGRYPVPVVILTRLGVDLTQQGRGLGSALVRDALLQVAAIAERVGVRALLIHAETREAAAFYQGIDSAFEQSPTDQLHLVLLIKDLRRAIGDAAGHGTQHVIEEAEQDRAATMGELTPDVSAAIQRSRTSTLAKLIADGRVTPALDPDTENLPMAVASSSGVTATMPLLAERERDRQ